MFNKAFFGAFLSFSCPFADFNLVQRNTLGGSTPQASYEVAIIRGCRIVNLKLETLEKGMKYVQT